MRSVSHPLLRNLHHQTADVRIGRPGPFGNPFHIGADGDRETVVGLFRAWFDTNPDLQRIVRRELAGKTLGCFCSPAACHGDVLAEYANNANMPSADPVFVFGSNLAGRHGRGSASFARRWRGAVSGTGVGMTGCSYAIPTKDAHLHTLPLPEIAGHVETFLRFASRQTSMAFDVTRVGCGLAGYRDADIAPLFADAPDNCRLPWVWRRLLRPESPIRVIIAGSRSIKVLPIDRIRHLLGAQTSPPTIVSGGAPGVDTLGERYAIDNGLPFVRVPAEWDRYGKAAGMIRNRHMAFLASHLIAVWDGVSPGTRNMIDVARADGLEVRVLLPKA